MTDARPPPSSLRGRLADVYVMALTSGAHDALSKRLGNRATVDDPIFGRASSLTSIESLLGRAAAYFTERGATYRAIASTTGVDRDVSEGIITLGTEASEARELPIAVVAERRRLREVELRLYYAAPPVTASAAEPRPSLASPNRPTMPQLVAHVVDAVKKGAIERILAAFEEGSRIVDPRGSAHAKRDGKMATFLTRLGGGVDLAAGGAADDGRTCCIEVAMIRPGRDPVPAALAFERGDSGLFRELRLYYEET